MRRPALITIFRLQRFAGSFSGFAAKITRFARLRTQSCQTYGPDIGGPGLNAASAKAVAEHASELIQTAALALRAGMTVGDLADQLFPLPHDGGRAQAGDGRRVIRLRRRAACPSCEHCNNDCEILHCPFP